MKFARQLEVRELEARLDLREIEEQRSEMLAKVRTLDAIAKRIRSGLVANTSPEDNGVLRGEDDSAVKGPYRE